MSSEMNLLDLPDLVIEEILCSLDFRSLAACCCVSREWNEYLNDHERIWMKYCENHGFKQPESVVDRTWNTWKEFSFLAVKRHDEVKNSRCFLPGSFRIRGGELVRNPDLKIVAIYFYGDCLGVATLFDIQIWETVPEMVLRLKKQTPSFNSSVKFDDRHLLVADIYDDISSYPSFSIRRVPYEHPLPRKGSLISYDFDSGSNILVGSFLGTPILIWQLSTGTLVRSILDESSDIGGITKIVPMHRPSGNDRGLHYLFLRKIDKLLMWRGTYADNANGVIEWSENPDVIHTEQPDRLVKYHDNILNHESNFLYYTLRSDTGERPEIQEWDLNLRAETRKIRTPSRIRRLIAVGKKYMVYLTEEDGTIIVLEISSGEILTKFQMSEQVLYSEIDMEQRVVVFCHQNWLDGIDLATDKGTIFAYARRDRTVHYVQWIKRHAFP